MDTSTRRTVRDTPGELRRELVRSMATPAGSACALVLPMYLSPLRSLVGRAPLLAVVAIVVAAAAVVGGRWSGLTTAGIGALSADAFLTAHRGTLHPDQATFWWTAALLALVALAADAIARR